MAAMVTTEATHGIRRIKDIPVLVAMVALAVAVLVLASARVEEMAVQVVRGLVASLIILTAMVPVAVLAIPVVPLFPWENFM